MKPAGGARRLRIGHGLADSALASLASFAIGLYASRRLPAETLGLYGIAFAGFQLAGTVPAELLCRPAEVASVHRSFAGQLRSLRGSMAAGGLLSASAALLVAAVVGFATANNESSHRAAVLWGLVAAATVSPLQDHVRRTLHQADRSSVAVTLSALQLVLAVVAVVGFDLGGMQPAAIPFAALAAANLGTLAAFCVFAFSVDAGPLSSHDLAFAVWDWLALRAVVGVGRSLLLAGGAMRIAAFTAAAVIGRIAGWRAAGQIEATRILAQPLVVLASGLITILRPAIVLALRDGAVGRARWMRRLFIAALVSCATALATVLGPPWPFNPLTRAFPAAYARTGLLAAMILATSLANCWTAYDAEFLALRRQQTFARTTIWASAAWLGGTATVLALGGGAFAMPAGMAAFGAVGAWYYSRALDPLHRQVAHQTSNISAQRSPQFLNGSTFSSRFLRWVGQPPSERHESVSIGCEGGAAALRRVSTSGQRLLVVGRPPAFGVIAAAGLHVVVPASAPSTRSDVAWYDVEYDEQPDVNIGSRTRGARELPAEVLRATGSPDAMVIVVQTQFRTEFLARIHALQVELSAAGYLIDTSGPCGPRREGFAALVVARRAVNPPDAASTGGSDFPLRPAAALLQAH